jgi:hypothetical protein
MEYKRYEEQRDIVILSLSVSSSKKYYGIEKKEGRRDEVEEEEERHFIATAKSFVFREGNGKNWHLRAAECGEDHIGE